MGCPAVVKVTAPGGPAVARVTVPSGPAVVRVAVPGPRGIQGEQGEAGANDLTTNATVDMSEVVDGSTLVYRAGQGVFVADATTTVKEIVNGGNF